MNERRDPESTRCTLYIDTTDRNLIEFGSPGDRVAICEKTADGRHTGLVITARILSVDRQRMTEQFVSDLPTRTN